VAHTHGQEIFEQVLPHTLDAYLGTDCHSEVCRSIVQLYLLGEHISIESILKEIKGWSPIEQLFYLAFLRLKIAKRINPDIKIEPQCTLSSRSGCYYMDFKLVLRDEVIQFLPPLVRWVKLDGCSYHERTPQEFTKGRQRVRELQRKGGKVYSFPGAEVFHDALKCVRETVSALDRDPVDRRLMIMDFTI
jgi:hypothetical protein